MADYTVTGVRKVLAEDFTHRHIEGVCTDDRVHHTVRAVVYSIRAGNTWKTKLGGYEETIKVADECPVPGCIVAPYIETNPWSPRKDNLENLDLC